MFGTWAFIAACGAFITGVAYYEKKKNEKNNNRAQSEKPSSFSDSTQEKVQIKRDVSQNINHVVRDVNHEFKCEIACNSVYPFISPGYGTEYTINNDKYVGYQTLENEKVGTSDNKFGCRCDRITLYKDAYGNKVVLLIHDIPCFDSGDREYDQNHLLYLFHNGGQTYALYCAEGYRMAKLILFENVKITNIRLKRFLKSEGFPV